MASGNGAFIFVVIVVGGGSSGGCGGAGAGADAAVVAAFDAVGLLLLSAFTGCRACGIFFNGARSFQRR